jgi:hypothetical protein
MNSTYARLLRIVNTYIVISAVLQVLYAILATLPQFLKIAKLDGFCRARFGARRD